MNNKPYLVALNHINGLGPQTLKKILKHWPDLQVLFELTPLQLANEGVPAPFIKKLATLDWKKVEADWRWEEKENHHLLTYADEAYPQLLREIPDPPIVLYARGDLNAFKQPCIAMVGTRKPSITGSETAAYFARQLSQQAITIVSGLALGIDAQVHQGCLDVNQKTIAVMGTGIDVIYPYRHRQLAEKIAQNGLILSEFPLKTAPFAGHFPRRNRIISGLSLATLIVEAAVKSGSLITARLAMEQNREVMAIPSSIHNPQARGCHHLLQQGAKLVTSIEDVLVELQLSKEGQNTSELKSKQLSVVDQAFVDCIGFEMTNIDKIMERSGFDVGCVTSFLGLLEIQGIIKAVPGGYMRCT